jgi:acetyl-CoA C-acetyltransferase
MARKIAIIGAGRTPIGKFLGAFSDHSAVALGTDVSRGVLDRCGVAEGGIDEVYFGHARQAGSGPNPARQVTIGSGLGHATPAFTINAACGSGLKSIAMGAEAIRNGEAQAVLTGGMESMTRVPFMLDRFRTGYRLGHGKVLDGMFKDGLFCPLAEMIMGETVEMLASEYDVSREEQDAWAMMTQHRAEAAIDDGRMAEEIIPVTVKGRRGDEIIVEADEHPRPGITMEGLAKLPPVFAKDGTITAGNSSGITDAAAALVLASDERVKELGVEPLGYVRDFTVAGVDPKRMGIGPVPATRRLLERNKMTLDDIDVIELNEAFAAQVIACERELKFDRERVNRVGGSISIGHPIGCTGSRIVVTLLGEMRRCDATLGLATLCVSGGLGMSMLIERSAT